MNEYINIFAPATM